MKQTVIKISCIAAVCSLLSLPAFSQEPVIRSLPVVLSGTSLHVNLVEQSDNGFLWLSTLKGLVRFDGINAQQILLPDTSSAISTMHCFSDKLFIGHENGSFTEMDCNSKNIVRHEKICESRITDFLATSDALWISTYGEGVFLLTSSGRLHINQASGLSDNFTYMLCSFNDGTHVVVATDAGVCIMHTSQPETGITVVDNTAGMEDNLVTAIHDLGKGTLLAGTESGQVYWIQNTERIARRIHALVPIATSRITSVTMMGNDVWLGTSANGIVSISWPPGQNLSQFFVEPGQKTAPVTDLLFTNDGSLLIADNKTDLHVVDTRLLTIRVHDDVDFSNATALTCNSKGQLWFATSEGLYRHSENFVTANLIESILPGLETQGIQVISMLEDQRGQLWMGTFDKGVARLDPLTNTIKWFTENDGLVNNSVLSICENGNELWFATLGGLSRIYNDNEPVFVNFNEPHQIGSVYVYCAFADVNGTMWFGTDGRGVLRFDGNNFDRLSDKFPALHKSVVSIVQDTYGALWFLGAEGKLQLLRNDTLEAFNAQGNEAGIEIFSICADHLGNVIVLTEKGAAVLNAEYGSSDFVDASTDFKCNFLNAIDNDPAGRVWLGAENCMLRYSESGGSLPEVPQTHITEVFLFLQPIDTARHSHFKYRENHLAFSFSGIWLKNPGEVTYRYMLDGFSFDWTTTKDDFVSFPQLPPGSYTFRVQSIAGHTLGLWQEANYVFVIEKPIWFRWWFIGGSILLIAFVSWYIFRMRIKALRRRESLARERVQSQFDTLRNQVNPHFLFNSFNTLISIIDRDKKLAIDFVEKLSDYFRSILQQQNKDVISLEEELSLLQNYFYLQQKRFGENLQLDIKVNEYALAYLVPPLTLQILAENAIKHNIVSKAKPLLIEVYEHYGNLIVRNNLQEKQEPVVSTGIGLQNIRNRYSILFSREIKVEKTMDHFIVELPLIGNMS